MTKTQQFKQKINIFFLEHKIDILALIIIFLIMQVMSDISPFYKYTYNNGDMNCSWAIAKAIMHGQKYFINIFEQRGLYFYFMQFYSYWPVKSAKLFGFTFEIINLYIIYLLAVKTTKLFNFGNKNSQKLFCTFLISLFVFLPCWSFSLEPEELSLTFIAYSAYLAVLFAKTKKLSYKQIFILGLFLGIITNIKYAEIGSICGLFFGYGVYLLIKHNFKQFIKTVLVAFLGLIIAFIPTFIYYQNQINIYFEKYFLNDASSFNLTISKLAAMFTPYFAMLTFWLFILIIPLVYFFKNITVPGRYIIFSQIFFTFLGILAIGRMGNTYAMPVALLILMYATGFGKSYKIFFKAIKNKPLKYGLKTAFIILTIYSVGFDIKYADFDSDYGLRMPTKDYYIKANNTQDYARQASLFFGKYGHKKDTLITLGGVTDNIYTYNNYYPRIYYFDQTSMSYKQYPTSTNMQLKYIKDNIVDWVEMPINIIDTSKKYTKRDYNYVYIKITKSNNDKHKHHWASVTAYAEYESLYPKYFTVKHNIRILNKNHYIYLNTNIFYPKLSVWYKPLLKNYLPVYIGTSKIEVGNKKISKKSGEILFLRKDLVKKYKMQNKVLNLTHLKNNRNNIVIN